MSIFSHYFSAEPKNPYEWPNEQAVLQETLRVMSFNVCCQSSEERKWHERKTDVASMVRFHRADIVGLQEPCQEQLVDLVCNLPEFHIFSGTCLKDEAVQAHNPILFRKSRFLLLDSGFFFLSPTPHLPSRGWDARYTRGVSWVKLLDRQSERQFYFFNTHFDYHSRKARDESALLLRQEVSNLAGKLPFIVVGDFNLFPNLGGEETYRILTEAQLQGRCFQDAQTLARFPHHGPTGSWSGFKEAGQPGIKPDYIFVDERIEVELHGILSDSFDGKFPSDHLPVVADVAFK